MTPSVHRFAAAARENACTVHGPLRAADAVEVVAALAAAGPSPARVAIDDDDWLVELGIASTLTERGTSVVRPGDAHWRALLPDAAIGVTAATYAAADVGIVALTAGRGRARSTSLVPPHHVCVVPGSRVLPTLEAVFAALGEHELPSAVTFVGGPSRTGDLEMVQTMGVHGPVRVDVVLVEV